MAQKFTVPITVKQLSSAGSDAISLFVDGDTNARLKLEAGGKLVWGSGSATGDVNLYRDEADVLKTDDTFKAPALFVDGIEIDTTGATTNQVLKYNGTKFAPAADATGAGSGSLDDLTDVVITTPEEFQGLSYNGTNWVNGYIPLVTYVRNAEATTLTTGTCVYLFGATGDHATVKRADNDTDTTSSKTIGVVGANIAASQNGPVITRGYVDGIDLSVGYTAGDVLWLGEDGAFTKTKPVSPDHLVFIGVVVRATSNGIIYVATQNGYEIDELHDVYILSPSAGQLLAYDSSGQWKNTNTVGSLTIDTAGTLVFEGATADGFETTVTVVDPTADRTITLPDATGTVALTADKLSVFAATSSSELAGVISDETGSGSLVFATSPSLTTPTLGVASATSINKVAITAPATSATLTIADGKTLTASNTLTFTGTDSSSVAFGTGGTVAYTANKLSAFASTSSSELAGVISDETGSGSLVFATSPAFTTSVTTGSTSFDLVNTTATTINFGGAATTLNIGNASGTVAIAGNLTVNGTTTTVNSTTLTVDDKNIELGSVTSPTDLTADGGGITLKGTTDKTFNWVDATDAWTSSEHLNLASGKAYYINGTSVLSGTTLGSGVTGSSLTSVGTIGTGTWQGSIITGTYGGTGVNNGSSTITVSGNTTIGSSTHTVAFATSANTSVTLPTTGTLATLAGSESLTNKKLGSLTTNGLVTTSGGDGTLSVTAMGTSVATALGVNVGSAGAFVVNGGALGTPSSGTLTNATGLPISGLTSSTSTALGVGSIELGHATDTTIARSAAGTVTIEGVEVTTNTATQTLTNKTFTAPKFADLGFIADSNGNEMLIFDQVASAVNNFQISNTITGGLSTVGPVLSAVGGDTNIDINITPKGAGVVNINAPKLSLNYASGDEGGELLLAQPPNGTLGGGITIDAYIDRLRFFEQGGTARGFYLNLASGAAGAGTEILYNGFTSPSFTTSITTGSTTFALLNTTATTINFGSAATTINIGGASTEATFAGRLLRDGNRTVAAWGISGPGIASGASTFTISSATAANATVANAMINSFGTPTIAAANSNVTATNSATVYINAAPTAGTNMSLTNRYAMFVNTGSVKVDDTASFIEVGYDQADALDNNDTTSIGVRLSGSGAIWASRNNGTLLVLNRMQHTAGQALVDLRTNGATKGTITENAGTVSYNAFLGSHYTEIDSEAPLLGTVMESTGVLVDGWLSDQSRLPKCKVSDTASSTAVFGIYFGEHFEEDIANGHLVASLGAAWVRMASGSTPALGDLIESNGDGCARVQEDTIIRSSTIGKLSSTTPAETYEDGSYLLPCVLYCG